MNQKHCRGCPHVDFNEMSDEMYCKLKDYEPIRLRWHKQRPDWCPLVKQKVGRMSIVVRDMEMPETCEDCPFHIYHSHYEYICVATPMFYPMNLANSKGIRKDWCPLVEAESGEK